MLKYTYINRWYIKKANNTNKQIISYKSWQNTHTQVSARTAILYIISVNVPEDYSLLQYTVDVQQDHSIRHCTQSLFPTRKFPTTLYTLTVQQDHSLPHSTKSLSVCNKTIPYHTVQSHCQSPTRNFPTTLYTVTVSIHQTIPCYTLHTHCLCPTRNSTALYKPTVGG